ncbi:hypothetical protein JWV37_10750 [Sulfurospirillum sp. T05]|uniref:Uncharacterized protein n=1 Tax=Sulfurospirillum tamanense TaxID=2813362 RepID=A0ABS2WUC4_9BACT|nr:hypothetical protein [Sulfurospirillum tamanensis]MBN2965261.1 hypothetical protein [Sulfurospirillum tamanensis]
MDIQDEIKALGRKNTLIKRIKAAEKIVKAKKTIYEKEQRKLDKLISEYNAIGKEEAHAPNQTA